VDDDGTLLTAEVVLDPSFFVNDARLVDEEEDDGGGVIDATPIVPWWKQRSGLALLGTVLVLLAAFVTAIGLSSRGVDPNGDVGNPPPEEVATKSNDTALAGKRGPRGTCPSDDSARDCGATLEIWMDVMGWSLMNLVVVTNNFSLPPNRTERPIDRRCRISGWLVPPITSDEYVLAMLMDGEAQLLLSADDDLVNKAIVSIFYESGSWTGAHGLKSGQLSFVAGRAYYFEVREMD
jgi:hypothetical protein